MTEIDRRLFLSGIVASLGGVAGGGSGWLQTLAPSARNRRIDVHHHFAPPAWLAEVKGRPMLNVANSTWTPERSLEDMDRSGLAAALVSITNPGLWFGDAQVTRRLVRACNDYGARMVQDHPTRFGLMAAMPLPDVDATLEEIAYAYDTLHADGVALFTSYGDIWLGNAAFRPVMAELHRRKAIVHVHPTAADCCRTLSYAPGVGPGTIEYGTDTTRAMIGVTFSGDAALFPDIRWIWSHAGGSAPFLAGRIEGASRTAKDRLPKGFLAEAKRFYYDLAGAANPGAVASLLQLVPSSHILFGTDFPSGGSSAEIVRSVSQLTLLTDEDRRAIERDNAVGLFPRFRG